MALRDVLRTRLALRIYLVGLAQFAVVAAGFIAILELNRPKGFPHEHQVRFFHAMITREMDNPRELQGVLDLMQTELHATVTVMDPDGAVFATNAPGAPPRCMPPRPGKFLEDRPPPCHVKLVRFPDGREGRIEQLAPFRPPPGPPITGPRLVAMVLVVVGISSWLLARTLTRPLRRLSSAARAFGGGDLKARAALPNRDELGDVSRAFDEMAERVTELLRAERELLANVSHELRTPLSRIRMALALVSEAEGDVAVAREMLGEIAGDLDELERLISDVLTAARLDLEDVESHAGIPPLRRERVDVHELLTHAASRFRTAHPQRSLRVDVPADLPSVDADPVLLRRVFDNLLENAHKYTDKASEPVELVARAGEDITVEVIDKGIGIAAADLSRVFRPFFRVDKSRTRATGGLGLGLPLAKRIIDAHGGKIELVSAPNEGTRACVRLPIAHLPSA
ncbi:sensor histidine kinase [Polyangium jinanense]|uniref:histidine kinase n=1 Tax=Polyangium jinanense TaxID=2829994 RepID=A0A9X4AY75_9BACT|nr:HAMP domain-containing sensor histidine kinase [Polyangium jinanense]MDC3960283.1 HAMP domain-containing histidine kinase [Polyangium jinanense]MDC3988506.1 HAMP domain-containing histidine kinase [Polyangium jinanense]